MISHGRLVGSLVTLLFLTACGKPNQGWENFPVPIYTQDNLLSSPQRVADFQAALNFWEEKAGRKLFDYKGTWKNSDPVYSGDVTNPSAILGNVVFFQNPWPYAYNVVGETTVYTEDRNIKAAFIILNPLTPFCEGDCQFTSATSIKKTFAHEFGHFLGLGHHDDVNNIMYATSVPGGSLSAVGVDQAALHALTHKD